MNSSVVTWINNSVREEAGVSTNYGQWWEPGLSCETTEWHFQVKADRLPVCYYLWFHSQHMTFSLLILFRYSECGRRSAFTWKCRSVVLQARPVLITALNPSRFLPHGVIYSTGIHCFWHFPMTSRIRGSLIITNLVMYRLCSWEMNYWYPPRLVWKFS